MSPELTLWFPPEKAASLNSVPVVPPIVEFEIMKIPRIVAVAFIEKFTLEEFVID